MRLDVPVDPDADTARRWAEDELSKPEYQEGAELSLDGLWEWFGRLFERIGDAGGAIGIPGAIAVGLLVAALVALVTWLVLGPLRRSRRGATERAVFDDDARSWSEIRDAARAATAAQEWDLAVVEWFRATVRLEDARGVILDSPGLTAHEAATRIGTAAPAVVADVLADADAFDVARYGGGGLTREHAEHAEQTFDQVTQRRAGAGASA